MREALSAFLLAMAMASGGALAQDGGTESGPGGTSTGVEAGSKPTLEDCARGWSPSSRWTWVEFQTTCSKL